MGRPAGWMKELTGRAAMKSPGKPSHRRGVERWFWREIAEGLSSEDAAHAVGVSSAAGVRWFRERGGMATFLLDEVSCRYLCFEEREEIAMLRAEGKGVRAIAREIGRAPSTISRELRRNAATRGGKLQDRASGAEGSRSGRRGRNGRPSWWRAGPRWPSSPVTSGCANTCKTGSPARFGGR